MKQKAEEEDALIEAIQSAPDDNDVRLVYADWLEEKSDPRAEYVRLEVELANVGYGAEDAEKRKNLEQLGQRFDPKWRLAIGRGPKVRILTKGPPRSQIAAKLAGSGMPKAAVKNLVTTMENAALSPQQRAEATRVQQARSLPTLDREAWRDDRVSSLPPSASNSFGRIRVNWFTAIILGVLLALGASCQYDKFKRWWNGETGYGVMPH